MNSILLIIILAVSNMEKFSDFKKKEVINICDGMKVGFVYDIEIDTRTGKICSIIIPVGNRRLSFLCINSVYIIPWEKIVRIGDDIILIDVCLANYERDC